MDSTKTRNSNLCEQAVNLLIEGNERLVLVDGCTGGKIASSLSEIPGIADCLCGSFVINRQKSNNSWLGVRNKTLKKSHLSQAVSQEMAVGSLKITPEAKWAVAVLGSLEKDLPKEKDGKVWICVAKRGKNKIRIKEAVLSSMLGSDNIKKSSAAEAAITILCRSIIKDRSKPEKQLPKT